jgi:hypothetical protein
MAIKKSNNEIRALFSGCSCPIAAWKFEPQFRVSIDHKATGAHVGHLDYQLKQYKISTAIQIRDWVFTLEWTTASSDQTPSPQLLPSVPVWYLCAFHRSEHYTYGPMPYVQESEHARFLLLLVMNKFWPILYPDLPVAPESLLAVTQEPSLESILQDFAGQWGKIGIRGGKGKLL